MSFFQQSFADGLIQEVPLQLGTVYRCSCKLSEAPSRSPDDMDEYVVEGTEKTGILGAAAFASGNKRKYPLALELAMMSMAAPALTALLAYIGQSFLFILHTREKVSTKSALCIYLPVFTGPLGRKPRKFLLSLQDSIASAGTNLQV